MQENIPNFLCEMLLKQYEENILNKILDGFVNKKPVTLRVNTIKSNKETVKKRLTEEKINFNEVSWNKNALIIENVNENEIKKLKIYEEGEIYLQSLSSMIPAIILNPKEDENILDMTAAPGGKTTQMAALCNNRAIITACEKKKIRS